jgi:hypothetical protein
MMVSQMAKAASAAFLLLLSALPSFAQQGNE